MDGRFISIDPGSAGCAWALWNDQLAPLSVRLWEPDSLHKGMWLHNALDVAGRIAVDVAVQGIRVVHCEEPKYFNEATAASNALVKLSIAVGCIAKAVQDAGATLKLVPVAQWMGQMSDVAVQHRVEDRLGAANCQHFKRHVWDAVAIGLFVKGRF